MRTRPAGRIGVPGVTYPQALRGPAPVEVPVADDDIPPGAFAHHRRPRRGAGRRPLWAWTRITLFVFAPIAGVAALYVGRLHIAWMISAYGALSLARIVSQSVMAAEVRARQRDVRGEPMVSIVVATLLEASKLDSFDRALQALARQDWPRYEVLVVDDGSDAEAAEGIARLCAAYGFRHFRQDNAGKRVAMKLAFDHLDSQSRFVLTGDDDTVWRRSATRRLVASMQSDPRIGATTGHVATLNADESWLTRLIAVRYWVAFQVERASQGYFGTVTCVSGPLGGYRRDLIDRIKDAFVSQRFLGRPCTFGDDRHLTNLVLGLGYRVDYSAAEAYTEVPATFRKYRKQQTRWGKSLWREMIWTFKVLPQHSLYLAADWALTLLLPFLLVASIGWYLYGAVTDTPAYLLGFAATVLVMATIRAIPAVVATRDARFLWMMPVFSVFHLAVLLPLKFVSLATVGAGGWGTRHATAPASHAGRHRRDR